jgi:hypothetical protein
MKKWIILLFLCLVVSISAPLTYINFSWNLNPPNESIERYIIYYAKGSNPYTVLTSVDGTNNNITKGFSTGTYKFKIVSSNSVGLSNPSPEIYIRINK